MSEARRKDDAWLRYAIEHARQVAEKHGDTPCGREHRQLVGWLEELRNLRAVGYLSRTLDALKKILELAKDGEASAPMSHAGDNCCHIVYACEDALSCLPQEPNENAGNMAKLREALEDSQSLLESFSWGEYGAQVREQMRDNQAALAAPPRKCDVGGATEQENRFFEFCTSRRGFCDACPLGDHRTTCKIWWGQLPYDAVQEGGEG